MQDAFEEQTELIRAHELESAKQLALKYVSARMRTKLEVTEYLQKKGCDKALIQSVTAFLAAYGYLDDTAYCRAWIHDRIQFHPCGRKKMAVELSKKIKDRQLIEQCLEEQFSAEDELALAQIAAEQKLHSRKTITREQLSRFLYSRGYSGSIIAQVCETAAVKPRYADTDADDFFAQDEF